VAAAWGRLVERIGRGNVANQERTDEAGGPERRLRRRAVIAAASGLVAATLAKAGQPALVQAAPDAGDFLLGVINTAESTTELDLQPSSTARGNGPALLVRNSGGTGIVGEVSVAPGPPDAPVPAGIGVLGVLGGTDPAAALDGIFMTLGSGVLGVSNIAAGPSGSTVTVTAGVVGVSNYAAGAIGRVRSHWGVITLKRGVSTSPQFGRWLDSTRGSGAAAISDGLAAVVGLAAGVGPAGGIGATQVSEIVGARAGDGAVGIAFSTQDDGVRAVNTAGGVGLAVRGRARFATAGNGTIPKGMNHFAVSNPAVTTTSHVTVTLGAAPGQSLVSWVDVVEGEFTIHLAAQTAAAAPFSYLVVEA